MAKIWLKGEYEFASMFSYRIPNFSPAYAPSSSMPGPSAVKLALVSTRIETTGQVLEGEALFEMVKEANIGLEPSAWSTTSKTFLRRLKRMKDGTLGQSFGIREYVHHGGPVGIYIKVDEAAAETVKETMRRLRRIGTSDSLLYCIQVQEMPPDPLVIARLLEDFQTILNPALFQGRPVIPLLDIKAGTKFKQVNPYESGGNFTTQQMYIFPLRIKQSGDGWTRYKREPFEIS
jgi:hypothetical protein